MELEHVGVVSLLDLDLDLATSGRGPEADVLLDLIIRLLLISVRGGDVVVDRTIHLCGCGSPLEAGRWRSGFSGDGSHDRAGLPLPPQQHRLVSGFVYCSRPPFNQS